MDGSNLGLRFASPRAITWQPFRLSRRFRKRNNPPRYLGGYGASAVFQIGIAGGSILERDGDADVHSAGRDAPAPRQAGRPPLRFRRRVPRYAVLCRIV